MYETIPYRSVYQNGIIEDYNGRFSKMYKIPDVNFDVEEDDIQEEMYIDYEKLVNSLDSQSIGQLTIINRNIDPDMIRNNILMKPKRDGAEQYRNEFNSFFATLLSEGHNNMIKEKYWTVSVKADNIVDGNDALKRNDRKVNQILRKVCKVDVNPSTIKDRLALMYDIFNPAEQLTFDKKMGDYFTTKGDVIDLDLAQMAKHSLHSKYAITPDSFDFANKHYLKLGDVYAKVMYLDHLPTSLSTSILDELTNVSCNVIASITYTQMPQELAARMVKQKLDGLNNQINRQQMDAAKEGITNSGATSAELENQRDATKDLIMEVAKRDQRIFKVTALVCVFATSKEELDNQCETIKSIARTNLCQMRALGNMQELAFNMCLPLAQDYFPEQLHRILTTESSCVFFPFTVKDLNQEDGIVYGTNPESQNLIRYNRKTGKNYNAIYLGESGSGKSFLIKTEIFQKFLNSQEKIIIIDPQGEYVKMVKELGGTVITLSQNSQLHINPLDMDMQYAGEGENPLPVKCAEIESLIGVMIGESMLGPIEKNLIHRVGTQLYKGYYNHMKEMIKQGITCDKQAMPTLKDFYSDLCKINDPSAQLLAQAIENYCIGSYSIFSDRTNVDMDARLICYDVSELSGILRELGMHVCMTDATNTMIANGRHGKWTSLYIDEFHLFTKTKSASAAMKTIFKTIRKFKGAPTIITQNIGDMLTNEEAQAMLDNTSFIVMMNQSPQDRIVLQQMYRIPSKLLTYITDQSYGHGLIYTGTAIVPFENQFPNETKSFELMRSQEKDKVTEEAEAQAG